jgi:hypothetical protein
MAEQPTNPDEPKGPGLGTVLAIVGGAAFAYLLFTSKTDKEKMHEEIGRLLQKRGLKGKELREAMEAVELADEIDWSGKSSEVVRVPKARIPKHLAKLGDAVAIVYRSRKSGKPKDYVHFFDSPHPAVGVHPKGKQIYFVGGKYKVNWRGINH